MFRYKLKAYSCTTFTHKQDGCASVLLRDTTIFSSRDSNCQPSVRQPRVDPNIWSLKEEHVITCFTQVGVLLLQNKFTQVEAKSTM